MEFEYGMRFFLNTKKSYLKKHLNTKNNLTGKISMYSNLELSGFF